MIVTKIIWYNIINFMAIALNISSCSLCKRFSSKIGPHFPFKIIDVSDVQYLFLGVHTTPIFRLSLRKMSFIFDFELCHNEGFRVWLNLEYFFQNDVFFSIQIIWFLK